MPDENVSLREFVERIIAEREKRYDQRFEFQQNAISVATSQLEKRLEGMNEFRETLKDQAKTFATVNDVKSLEKELRIVQDYKIVAEGKASQFSVNVAMIMSVLGLLLSLGGLIAHFLK